MNLREELYGPVVAISRKDIPLSKFEVDLAKGLRKIREQAELKQMKKSAKFRNKVIFKTKVI